MMPAIVGNDKETTVNVGMLISETFQKAKRKNNKDMNQPCAP